MSGLTASVLLCNEFSPADTGRVTRLLKQHAVDVTETRKGRYWTFVIDDAVVSLSVMNTKKHACDFDDDLLDNSMNYENAPDAIVLAFPTSRESDHEKCIELISQLTEMFGGVNCGIRS